MIYIFNSNPLYLRFLFALINFKNKTLSFFEDFKLQSYARAYWSMPSYATDTVGIHNTSAL